MDRRTDGCASFQHTPQTLPVVLDVGTNNAEKLKDPLYIGLRQNRITPDEEKEFVAEFMQATQKRWPGMVVQFEDVSVETQAAVAVAQSCVRVLPTKVLISQSQPHPSLHLQFSTELAFDLLDQHRNNYPTFNDDIQGTAAVSLAGFINAISESEIPLKDHKIVFFGAGSAAVGIAKLVSVGFPSKARGNREKWQHE